MGVALVTLDADIDVEDEADVEVGIPVVIVVDPSDTDIPATVVAVELARVLLAVVCVGDPGTCALGRTVSFAPQAAAVFQPFSHQSAPLTR